jgi:CRP-like cAMP-binding protein
LGWAILLTAKMTLRTTADSSSLPAVKSAQSTAVIGPGDRAMRQLGSPSSGAHANQLWGFDFWSGLTDDAAALLRSRIIQREVQAGNQFIRNGGTDDCIFFVQSGEVEVRRDSKLLAKLASGDVVGEMALLNNEPRNADVLAVTDCQLWQLSASEFHALCRELPQLKLVLTRLVAHRLNWSGSDLLARRVGTYQVLQEVGRGNMGWVFRAIRDGQTYALKMLPHPLVQRPGFLERYRNEEQLLRRLRHQNIVSLCDAIELYGTMFLVLEFVEGTNLTAWSERCGHPSADDARCIALSITRALQTAHAQGIIHRDVKPGNVMINTAGIVKLVDFGIAVAGDCQAGGTGYSLTPRYAAPEQFGGNRCGPETDYYSLGVLLYELITGQAPFEAENILGWAHAHIELSPRPLPPGSQPEDLTKFINAALLKDPTQRRNALKAVLQKWSQITGDLVVSRASISDPVEAKTPVDSATVVSQ